MAFSNEPLSPPEADDFQRMGLRRMEFRPPVIRRAIIRSAQPLVLMHLRSPSAEAERLLVNVMLSGYRLLDPRRRDDTNQRVMLGRIHPQLVEEAVSLAQAQPAAASVSVGVAGGGSHVSTVAAVMASAASKNSGHARLPSEFSPIAEWDWSELIEATLDGKSGLQASGFAPPLNTSNRFLEMTGSASWDETLTGSDLMVRPTYQRIYRAIRRRLVRASVVPLVSGAMLAASILLVLTWRTTVWIRSLGERRASVEVAEAVLSAGEVAGIAAAPLAAEGRKTADPNALPSDTAQTTTIGRDGVVAKSPDIHQATAMLPTTGGTGAGGSAASTSPPAGPNVAMAPQSGDNLDPAISDTVPAAPPAGSVAGPSLSSGRNESSTSGVDLASGTVPLPEIASEPVATDAMASASTAASAAKEADTERSGLEFLGLAEPSGESGGPAVAIVDAIRLPPLPDENLLGSARLRVEAAARAIRVAEGGAPLVGRAAAASGVATFRMVAGDSAVGSAERYVATLLAGQAGALAGMPREANRAIVDLTLTFDIDRDAAMMRLARWMAADVAAIDELRAVGTWIDGQMRASMIAGELALAGELVSVMHEVGLKHRDDALKSDAKLWRDVLVISQRYADAAARVEAAGDASGASPEDRGLAGRYWAQVRRDWHRALPHFAACSTSKLIKLAGIELLGGQTIDAEDANALADGYLTEAKRAKGWLGESFALRSHERLTLAAANSDRLVAMELNRRAGLVKVDHPRAFVPADDRVAASDGAGGDGAGRGGLSGGEPSSKPASGSIVPAEGASLSLPDRGPARMFGRLRVGGEDAAVLIGYQAGVPLTRKLVDQIFVGLENTGGMTASEVAARAIELAFVGSLRVDGPKPVSFHLAGNGPGGIQTLSINGRLLPIDSAALTRSPKRFEVDLMRGEYLIRWTTTVVDGDQLSLRAVDESAGELIEIYAPPAAIDNHPGALPTRLQVNLIAAE